MATIDSKEIVNAVAAGKYADDQPLQIVEYTNAWGKVTWGVTFNGEDKHRYHDSEFIRSPQVIWCIEEGWKEGLIK